MTATQRRVLAIIERIDRNKALRADRHGNLYAPTPGSDRERPVEVSEAILLVRRYDDDHRTCSVEIRRAVVSTIIERAALGHDCDCDWCTRGRA